MLADWVQSGESLAAFARRNQLDLHRLQWRRSQLAQRPASAAREPIRPLPVVPRQAPLIALESGAASAVSVTVGSARVDVSDVRQTDRRWLAALVAELQRRPVVILLSSPARIYIAVEPTTMRRSFDGLMAQVRSVASMRSMSSTLRADSNKRIHAAHRTRTAVAQPVPVFGRLRR